MRWSPVRKPATGLTCSFRPDAPVLMLRLLGRRPEGAVTNQPRATPWDHVQQPGPSTESAILNSVLGGLRARKSGDLWRPYRAFPFLESRFPGRCPGLACCFPFGVEFQNSATSKRARGDRRCHALAAAGVVRRRVGLMWSGLLGSRIDANGRGRSMLG
jgi:hypothetical protein